ncbi:hypothetical protein [Desertivirga arenae]|uniref:hypothetical protein n=1 Tax=Desertivirga arenae TaxID=2810309 RepID=UPI001A9668A8|nr:hypothetical protein [Pedobacter sp. SYSU D00823]
MDDYVVALQLSQFLKDWFNSSEKTKISTANLSSSFDYDRGYIIIDVDHINTEYCKYFKKDVFEKNAELLIKKLAEVTKVWMWCNEVHQYHLRLRIRNRNKELQQQALLKTEGY